MLTRTVVLTAFCLLMMVVAGDAGAACQICFPNCTNATSGVDGKTKCSSGSNFCKLEGNACKGGGSNSCECGTMGCEPCDAVCAPSAPPANWTLTRVEVTTPAQPPVEWRLVSVTPARRS